MKTRRPNLLFVFADQMRGCDMHCAGNPEVSTPAIDQLASEGARLTNCNATYPVCGPNRACLLTGTYATTNRVLGNDLPVRTDLPSFGTIAKDNGYRTGYIGKWHLDGMPRDRFTPPGPRRLGFDHWAVYNCSHRYFDAKYYRDTPELIRDSRYEPVVQTDLALDFLDQQSRSDDPFLLMLSWGPPHDPYEAVPDAYKALYPDPPSLTPRPNAKASKPNPLAFHFDKPLQYLQTLANYYAAISALDDQLARLLDRLDALGMAEDTMVVFTSDHGDMLWSHGWMKKQSPYEEAANVPFILRWPGRVASHVDPSLLATVDLLPTLGSMLSWRLPESLQGQNVADTLLGRAAPAVTGSRLMINTLSEDEGTRQQMPIWRGLRTQRYTYAETVGRQPWLLFDNANDPYQMNNLLGQPQGNQLLPQMQADLGDWLARTSDPFLAPEQQLAHFNLLEAWQDREAWKARGWVSQKV